MSQELLHSLEYIEKEKNIKKEILIETLKSALISACRKTYKDHDPEAFRVDIDLITGDITLFNGDEEINDPDFGRIAAQTAKQVIIQKIREAERESIFQDFLEKKGDLVSGVIHLVEKRALIVNLGKADGILPNREQYANDTYRQGSHIRCYLLEVNKTTRGPEIILSRTHPNLVKCLFELEVPEIHDSIVEIKGVAREAGARTKIAVHSNDEKVDCVGSCVGMRGQRVKNIVRELQGEKIDIVRWNPDTEVFIRHALAPAELQEVKLNRTEQRAEIILNDDQLSLAIGKRGQNVRLASKLTGWELDIRSASQKIPISSLDGVGPKTEGLLKTAGITTIKDIIKSSVEELLKIDGIGQKTAEKIVTAAHRAIVESDKSSTRNLDSLL